MSEKKEKWRGRIPSGLLGPPLTSPPRTDRPAAVESACPFCQVPEERIVMTLGSGMALHDSYPVAEGHTLVVPEAHVASLFDLPEERQAELWKLVVMVRDHLTEELHPAGFNVGVNDGLAAGQTVAHAHIHVIPRFEGDAPDPRGGVRWLLPEKAA